MVLRIKGVDDFHQRVLDRFLVFDQRDGMKRRLWWTADASEGVLVEVAELLSAESRGAAGDSGDFDMSAGASGHRRVDIGEWT